KRPEMLNIMKDFPKIIFMVFTNGTLIDENMRTSLKKNRNIIPLVSIEGDQEHTDFRRGEGTFFFLSNIMKQMKNKNLFFGNSITLTSTNFSSVMNESYIKELVDYGCKFFLFLEYTPTDETTNDWVLSEEQRSMVAGLMEVYRNKYPALFIGVPWDEEDVGGCMSSGRGFVHINANGDLEPCPFAPYSDVNLNNTTLKEALQSEFIKTLRNYEGLIEETGGGCVLWQNRELVQTILNKTNENKYNKTA
ncbi:radical SAM protein, partial [Bacteroidota bacterium]